MDWKGERLDKETSQQATAIVQLKDDEGLKQVAAEEVRRDRFNIVEVDWTALVTAQRGTVKKARGFLIMMIGKMMVHLNKRRNTELQVLGCIMKSGIEEGNECGLGHVEFEVLEENTDRNCHLK